jgi:HK97 family phage major capsid protein
MAYAFALKEDQCGFIGDGSATYGGIKGLTTRILEAANTAGAVDCATAGHDTFADVDNTDLSKLMGALPKFALMNAKFYCSQVCKSLVFDRLKATAGGNTVQTLQGTTGDNYLGYPIVVSQVLPTSTGDLNNLPMLFFGDLSKAATMGERRGITVKRDDSIKFVEDQIALKATERIDINVHDLGDTSTAGPIVGLIGFTS